MDSNPGMLTSETSWLLTMTQVGSVCGGGRGDHKVNLSTPPFSPPLAPEAGERNWEGWGTLGGPSHSPDSFLTHFWGGKGALKGVVCCPVAYSQLAQ